MTRRAKDVAQAAASASGAVASAVWRPFVHPWMLAEPACVQHSVAQLDDHLPRIEAALAAAGVGDARTALVEAVRSVRDALEVLATAMETDGARLHHLIRTRPFDVGQIRACTDALSAADGVCRSAMIAARAALPTLGDVLVGSAWERPELTPVEATRAGIAEVTTADLPGVIARSPELLASLTDLDDNAAPEWLIPALASSESEPGRPVHEASLLRVDRVRRACSQQSAETLTRAGLLFPRVMGNTDGVPLVQRIAANRLVMRADVRRMGAADIAFADEVTVERNHDAASAVRTLQGAALDAWLANDKVTAIATVKSGRASSRRGELRDLIALTQRLLHDRYPQGRGRSGHRQVVQFNPDGHVVELWGSIEEETEHVAVYVGGTGTTVRQFGWPTTIVRALLRADPTGRTAVVTWMGAEFPSAIGTQSPFGRFARAAAAPLRDAVEALDVPDDVPITVVAHSYGGTIVGAAEALGLRADRVVLAGVPGIGPGVRSVEDYPTHDALGRERHVTRYSLTAPGDLIRVWRKGNAALASAAAFRFAPVGAAASWVGERVLGADPMTLPGIIDLDPGVWEVDRDDRRAGEILFGPRGHADTVEEGTTSFRRIVAVIQGRDPREIAPPAGLTPFTWRPGRR